MPFTIIDPTTAAAAPVVTIGAPLTSQGETLSTFQAEITAMLQGRTDINNTRLNRWINQGYYWLTGMLDLAELTTSFVIPGVSNQPLYTLPGQVRWIKYASCEAPTILTITGGGQMEQIDLDQYRKLMDNAQFLSSFHGTPFLPVKWFRFQRVFVTYPQTTAGSGLFNFTLDAKFRPQALVNANDSPIVDLEFHECLMYAGLARAWQGLRNPQAAAVAMNTAVTTLRTLKDPDAEERASSLHPGIQPAYTKTYLYGNRG